MKTEMFLGIDGGGSKTTGVIIDGQGRILTQCRGPSSAIKGCPSAQSCAVLQDMLSRLLLDAGAQRDNIRMGAIGLNGVDFPSEYSMQHREISQTIGIPVERLALVNDGIAALWGATSESAAAIIQLGSGFTAAFRSGHGHEMLFDHLNVGRSFDLRGELIALVARMIDGRAESTPLKAVALKHFGINSENEYAEAIYTGRVNHIKNTPPLVFQAWQDEDPAATGLIHRMADDLMNTCLLYTSDAADE